MFKPVCESAAYQSYRGHRSSTILPPPHEITNLPNYAVLVSATSHLTSSRLSGHPHSSHPGSPTHQRLTAIFHPSITPPLGSRPRPPRPTCHHPSLSPPPWATTLLPSLLIPLLLRSTQSHGAFTYFLYSLPSCSASTFTPEPHNPDAHLFSSFITFFLGTLIWNTLFTLPEQYHFSRPSQEHTTFHLLATGHQRYRPLNSTALASPPSLPPIPLTSCPILLHSSNIAILPPPFNVSPSPLPILSSR